MAHLEKFKMPACGNMTHHYRRDREATLERDNIDRERTHLNYSFGPDGGLDRIRERVAEVEATMTRSVRSDAVVMADWVVTAPPDVREEDLRRFFESTYSFVRERYGEENMLGGYVHMDETTPHIHIALTPVVERDGGRLAFSAKDMFNRQELLRFHGELSERIERDLGYRTQIELGQERTLERALSRAGSLEEYQKAKDGLERLRRDERELGERNRALGERAGELQRALREAQVRERSIEEAHRAREAKVEELREQVGGAKGEHQRLEAEDKRFEQEYSRLEGVRERLAERVRGLRERLEHALERVRKLLPHQRDIAPERAPEGLERVRSLASGFARVEELSERKLELQRRYYSVAREFGEDRSERIREIGERLDGKSYDPGRGLERTLERAERTVEQRQRELDRLEEHRLRNRKEIPEASRRLEEARQSRDDLRLERDRLAEERARLEEYERARRESVERAREPIRAERDEVAREYERGLRELQRGYRELSDDQRRELERSMEGRGNPTYEMTRGGYESELRQREIDRAIERCEGLVRDINQHSEPEHQRESIERLGRELSRLEPEDREIVFEHTEGIGRRSWDEIRDASKELREEGRDHGLVASVERSMDRDFMLEHEREWDREWDRGR